MKETCYCGTKITKQTAPLHFESCEDWQNNSLFFRAARRSLRRGYSHQWLEMECAAIPFIFSDQPEPPSENLWCEYCGKQYSNMEKLILLECGHLICREDLIERVFENYPDIRCLLNPEHLLTEAEILDLIGEEGVSKLVFNQLVENSEGKLVECVCGTTSILEPGTIDYSYTDSEGRKLSKAAAVDMANNRFRCTCKRVFCASCKTEPYHLGFTCEEFKKFKNSDHCRFCNKIVKVGKKVCEESECKEKEKIACSKILECGHLCSGVEGELECLDCLHEDCSEGQTREDFCSICYIEGLGAAPCVKLVCGHILHYSCLMTTLKKRWVGPRINFRFAKCPTCKEWVNAFENWDIVQIMDEIFELYDDIREKSIKRLKFEQMEEDVRLKDKNSPYFMKPELYAIDRFAYYECFRCKKPYFGGKKECEENLDREEYRPDELVCPACAAVGIKGASCPSHGNEFIEFKCKFCCSIAAWFCWGNTHFCDDCHTRQNSGDYLTRKKKNELPVCPGKACPLKVEHPPNGEEFALGCAVCRNVVIMNF